MKTFGILKLCIKAGEIICVDDPTVAVLCPDIKDNIKCHCLHCFRPTKAPLPCDVSFVIIAHHKKNFSFHQNCCSVVFCSKKCKEEANNSYHQYECALKLYEMFENEGNDMIKLFVGLRAVTQKPLQYFSENRQEIEKFLSNTSVGTYIVQLTHI